MEPMFKLEVVIPEEYIWATLWAISTHAADDLKAWKNATALQVIIHGIVPLAEMFGYATSPRSKTQGRGVYTMQFEHYEPVPKSVRMTSTERTNKFFPVF